MTLRTQYILFIVTIHLVTLVLAFFIFQENKLLFIGSEAIVLLSLFFSIRLYQHLVQPLKLLVTGVDAIKDRDFNVKFSNTGKYEMDQLIQVYNQMMDQLREERRLQQEQHFFLDKLIENSPTGVLILDFDGKIERINPKAQELLQLKNVSISGQSLQTLAHPLAQYLANLPENSSETIAINSIRTYKCQKSHFIDRGFSRHFILIEELTEEILRTEKNAYGRIIRVMAHEVNNSIGPINSILGSVLNYQNQLKEDDKADFVQAIEVARQRNQRLSTFMRNFADVVRLPLPNRSRMDVRKLVESTVQLLQAEAEKRQIHLHQDVPIEPSWVHADEFQLEQVLLNVAKNALEAIGSGGEIHFILQAHPRKLVVKNNGTPILPEQEEKIFSPFYTSKKEGQGIGLTLTREILLNHNFSFSLHTKADGWTYFELEF